MPARSLASFDLLCNRTHTKHAFDWAFDLLVLDGEDPRAEPLDRRRAELQALLKAVRRSAWRSNDAVTGDGRLSLYAQACAMGLEGIVSKRATSRYRSGRSADWVRAKNPASLAARREAEGVGW